MPALSLGNVIEDKGENMACEKLQNSYCPLVAVPEKIVFCVDVAEDNNCKSYTLKNETSCDSFQLLKKTLASFVNNKISFNSEHKFAVMSLEPGGVKWIHDFSSDTKEIINAINDLELIRLTEPEEVNLTPVFKELHKQVGSLPQVRINNVQFPTHVIRLILVYNSSYNIPKIEVTDETFTILTSSKYFHWDTLYFHDAPTADNKCQDVYNVFLNASLAGSYVFESSRKIVKVFNSMAKLLAHPLQRFELPFME